MAEDAAFACDDAHIFFNHPTKGRAWLYIVLGNEGWTVVSDYTTNLDSAVAATDDLVRKYEREYDSDYIAPLSHAVFVVDESTFHPQCSVCRRFHGPEVKHECE